MRIWALAERKCSERIAAQRRAFGCSDGIAARCIGGHILDVVEHRAVGDVADGGDDLQLGGTLVDREDAGVAIQALASILEHEARTAMHLNAVVGVLVSIL
jgi:hypothetical protein